MWEAALIIVKCSGMKNWKLSQVEKYGLHNSNHNSKKNGDL